jgi:uncharacterized Zn-binding protein involved in type VI secretion
MPEHKDNESINFFVSVGLCTGRGGGVTRVTTQAEYQGMALARVGDWVTYDDGSEATIIDGAGYAAAWGDKPFALVGSRLSNGDTIAETLQDGCGIRVRDGEPVPGLFDPGYKLPPTPWRTERATMRKAAVRDGDPTTTRGFVIGTSTRINDNGKKVALDGDEATCGNCEGLHKIIRTGKGISDKGRNVVVDGDSVLCPCKKNRVIVGSNLRIFLTTNKGSAVASSAAGGFSVASTLASSPRFAEDDDSEEPYPAPVSDARPKPIAPISMARKLALTRQPTYTSTQTT